MLTNRRHVLGGLVAAGSGMAGLSAAGAAPEISFLVVGDWGRDGASHQRDVAEQMDIAATQYDCACVVSVGDNFYEDGVLSVDDPKWRSSFEDIYNGPRLLRTPWYVALGNHDYGGVPQAQVDYTARSARWKMPARYFKVAGASLGHPSVDLFIIDTCPMIDENATGGNAMAGNVKTQDAKAQLAWLDRELGASQAKVKFVCGHHTLFSGGSTHGFALAAIGLTENPAAARDARASRADKLPEKDSAAFAIAAERAQLEPRYRKRTLGLDRNSDAAYPHFYPWTVIPTWGEGFDYFWVDKRTGTVWGGYSACTPIHSPELAALQARFRRRFHISVSTVQQIDREGSPQEECRS